MCGSAANISESALPKPCVASLIWYQSAPLLSVCQSAFLPSIVAAAYKARVPLLVAGAPKAKFQAFVTLGSAVAVLP